MKDSKSSMSYVRVFRILPTVQKPQNSHTDLDPACQNSSSLYDQKNRYLLKNIYEDSKSGCATTKL